MSVWNDVEWCGVERCGVVWLLVKWPLSFAFVPLPVLLKLCRVRRPKAACSARACALQRGPRRKGCACAAHALSLESVRLRSAGARPRTRECGAAMPL